MNHNGYTRNDFRSTHALSSIARRSWCTFSADFRSDLWASGVSGCPWLVALRIHSGPPYTFHTSEKRKSRLLMMMNGSRYYRLDNNKWQSMIILNDRWWPLSTHKNTKHLWQLVTDKSHQRCKLPFLCYFRSILCINLMPLSLVWLANYSANLTIFFRVAHWVPSWLLRDFHWSTSFKAIWIKILWSGNFGRLAGRFTGHRVWQRRSTRNTVTAMHHFACEHLDFRTR